MTQMIFNMDMDIDMDMAIAKRVRFSDQIEIGYTYSREIYDRSIIDSVIVLRNRRQLNDIEWRKIFIELNQFKIYEMQIHPDSKNYTSISKIPSICITSVQAKNIFFSKYLVNKAN